MTPEQLRAAIARLEAAAGVGLAEARLAAYWEWFETVDIDAMDSGQLDGFVAHCSVHPSEREVETSWPTRQPKP